MDVSLPDYQHKFWGEQLPRYVKALSERFGPDVHRDPLLRTICAQSDDANLLSGELGDKTQVVDVVQRLMRLAVGDLSSSVSEDAKSEQGSDGSCIKPLWSLYSSIPLNSRQQIRLIELHPAQPGDLITINLFVVDNASEHSYEALSYVWGPRDSDVRVQVNGNPFDVSANLAEALRCLRPGQGDAGRVLWVDAICINQADDAEKSHQVAMMGHIYREAMVVLIFLGEERDNSALIMQYLKHEDTEEPKPPTGHSGQVEPGSQDEKDKQAEKIVLERIQRCQIDPVQLLRAGDAFFKRPWWSRTWVVQEYALARREPRWYCGTTWVSTANVRERLVELCGLLIQRSMPLFGEPDLLTDTSIDPGKQWGPMMFRRRFNMRLLLTYGRDNWESLLPFHVLLRMLYRECTDPRDRLFATREMLDPVSKEIFVPDYKATVEDVFLKLTSYLFITGPMNQHVYGKFALMQAPRLPSWVLDFSKPLPAVADWFLGRAADKASWANFSSFPVAYNRVFGASGFAVDKLDRVCPLGDAGDGMKCQEALWRLEGLLQNHHPSEALPDCARPCVPEHCLVPFPGLAGDSEAAPPEALKLLFPTAPNMPGYLPFVVETTHMIPLTPGRFHPDSLTCYKWKDSSGLPGFPTALGKLVRAVQSPVENFLAGACFDRANLEAQLLEVELGVDAPGPSSTADKLSDHREYRPQYAHIKAVLSQAQTEDELHQLKRTISSLVDRCIELVADSLDGQAPTGSQLIEVVRNHATVQLQKTLCSYRRILEGCSCSGEDRQGHRSIISKIAKGVVLGVTETAASLEQALTWTNRYDMDSMEMSGEAAVTIAKDFKKVFITRRGFVGLIFQPDSGVEVGDTLGVLEGMAMPVILEEVQNSRDCRLKGLAHVVGFQDVDLGRLEELGVCTRRDFRIV